MNKYGLLGKKLGHSYSKIIHQQIFNNNHLDCTYDLIEIDESELPLYISYLKQGLYSGYNVTIPYKEKIIPYLDELTIHAKDIGACNTVYLQNGKVIGDNTDYSGFISELNYYKINLKGKEVYVLGSGGASKAIQYALKRIGAKAIVVSRDSNLGITYKKLDVIKHFDAIINTTPVGMFPDVNSCPLIEDIIRRSDLCIDLIFNPKETVFLKKSLRGYNGLVMLIYQALEAEKIWQNNSYLLIDIEKLLKIL